MNSKLIEKQRSNSIEADRLRAYQLGMTYEAFVARRAKLKQQLLFIHLKAGLRKTP